MLAEQGLIGLPKNALSIIVRYLPPADKKRLTLTCSCLQQACRWTDHCVALSQPDLESGYIGALSAFPAISRLDLLQVSLCPELLLELHTCTHLLGCLRHLQVDRVAVLQASAIIAIMLQSCMVDTKIDTGTAILAKVFNTPCMDSPVVLQLLDLCPNLTELVIRGDWSSSEMQSSNLRRPQQLQRLAVQHNTLLSDALLIQILTAASTSGDCNCTDQQLFMPLDQQQHCGVPAWCAALWGTCSHSSSSTTPTPAWQHLTHLGLAACPKLGSSLGFMAWCPALRSLSLHSCFKVTDATLQQLSGSGTGADSVVCSPGTPAEPRGSLNASSLPVLLPLEYLDLSYTRVKDPGMPGLVAAMPHLRWLSLKGCNVGDDGLVALLQLHQLTALHLKHCHRVTEEGIQVLSALSSLCSFSYGYTSMPEADEVATFIGKQFSALTALDLLASELTDAGMMALSGLQHLQVLKLYQAGVTVEGLAELACQPAGGGLSSLVLYGTGALRSLSHLGAFPALQEIQLGSLCDLSAVMADAVVALTAVQRLTSLTLERMDGLCVEALTNVLRGCRQLMLLRVRGCDGICQEDMEHLVQRSSATCGSSASLAWAASPSCDTDDEEDWWQMVT